MLAQCYVKYGDEQDLRLARQVDIRDRECWLSRRRAFLGRGVKTPGAVGPSKEFKFAGNM
jgi:hypothetical protein